MKNTYQINPKDLVSIFAYNFTLDTQCCPAQCDHGEPLKIWKIHITKKINVSLFMFDKCNLPQHQVSMFLVEYIYDSL